MVVALLENGLKTTREATPPVAVFADPAVLMMAPHELTLAGLGDLVSKPFCGCDWKIAALVKGEYHCPMPDRLLSAPFERALDVFLRERGYTIAAVTIDNQEWMVADVYVRAKRRGDRETMQKVVDAYVPFMESSCVHRSRDTKFNSSQILSKTMTRSSGN